MAAAFLYFEFHEIGCNLSIICDSLRVLFRKIEEEIDMDAIAQ